MIIYIILYNIIHKLLKIFETYNIFNYKLSKYFINYFIVKNSLNKKILLNIFKILILIQYFQNYQLMMFKAF